MGRGAAAAVGTQSDGPAQRSGAAYAVGWGSFLALVVLVPLIIGAVPSQLGPLALAHANDPVSLPKAVAFLVLSGLSLAALCVSVFQGRAELRWHPVLWVLVALFAWAGISTIFSVSPALSVWGSYLRNDGLVAVFGYALVAFLAIQYVRSASELRAVMIAAVVAGSLVSAYAVLQFNGVDPIDWVSGVDRVFSTFGNADMLGGYLVFPFSLAIGLAVSTSHKGRAVGWWSAAVLIAAALLMTATRAAWLGASVVLIGLAFVGGRRVRGAPSRQKLAFGGLVLAVIAGTALAAALIRPQFAGRSATLSSGLAKLSSGRTVIWLTGLRGWLAHPITGWGPDGFGRAFESAVGADWYKIVGGLGSADNAHNFLIQALVTLGIPGLVLTTWALAQTAIGSFQRVRTTTGHSQLLFLSLWSALIGLMVALALGVTMPGVSAWLWLTVGLLLAPASHRISDAPKVALATGIALGVAVALWASSWLVADVIVGHALEQPPGPAQVAALQGAVQLNPISQNYRGLLADALVNQAIAEQQAGESRQIADATMNRAISAYYAAANADRGDVLVRVALTNALISFATRHPGSDASQRAVQVALDAVKLAPHNAVALVMLARAYQAAGLRDQAQSTARLASSVAPAYSMQTLGPLGLDATATP